MFLAKISTLSLRAGAVCSLCKRDQRELDAADCIPTLLEVAVQRLPERDGELVSSYLERYSTKETEKCWRIVTRRRNAHFVSF